MSLTTMNEKKEIMNLKEKDLEEGKGRETM